jgi:hypothetical protein
MRTITKNICTFDELNPTVQEKVLDNNRDVLVRFDWWRDTVSEDIRGIAKLNITGFDFHPHRHISATFYGNAKSSALSVISEHGKDCTTYSIANKFLSDLEQLESASCRNIHDIVSLEEDYLNDISNEYLNILEKEEQDLMSDEAITEHIIDNEWEFYENGDVYKS